MFCIVSYRLFFSPNIGYFIVCQPINRGIRVNLSYSQSEADYDKSYCLASMTDFRDNLVFATESGPNTFQGITIMGLKPGEGRALYQKLLPYAFLIEAALCCFPALLWKMSAYENLRASVRFVADLTEKVSSTLEFQYAGYSRKTEQSYMIVPQDFNNQVDFWSGKAFLARVYTLKLMLNLGLLILIVCFYMAFPSLNYFNLQSHFVCHVHRQTLITCSFPDIDLFKMAWIVNIVLLDICIIIIVLQLINVVFCLPRKKTFFSRHLGVEERNSCSLTNDFHLISYFCYENLDKMNSAILFTSCGHRTGLNSPLISLETSEEECNTSPSSPSLSYATAPQVFRRSTVGDEETK